MLARKVGLWGLCGCLLIAGCDGDEGGEGDTDGTDGTSMTPTSTTAPDPSTTGSGDPPGSSGASDDDSSTGEASDGSTSSGQAATGSSGGVAETGSEDETGTTGAATFDEEFVWVADFVRENCVQCHANDANGNLILPSADMTNDEVRVALDGIVANSGLLLVEPGDRSASQTYLQITNEFGAQFPTELTDRFGDWIDAGAPYFAQ